MTANLRRPMRLRSLSLLILAVVLLCALPSGALAASTGHPLRILVSNDDGVRAPGIDALVQALRKQPDVKITVVAPTKNQSGTGGKTTPGGVTGHKSTTKSGYPAWSVPGFPADAVAFALKSVVKKTDVDLVIAGINQGANLGPFVNLSGTVGAARAGAAAGIPALATSAGTPTTTNFAAAVVTTIAWLKANRAHLHKGTVQNLNTPECSAGAVRGTMNVTSSPTLASGVNPFVAVDCTQTTAAAADDVGAFLQGYATLTKIPATATS